MLMNLCTTHVDTPIGRIVIEGDEEAVTGLYFPNHKGWTASEDRVRPSDEAFRGVRSQLEEYFAGERQVFDVPLRFAGTPFQEQVWRALREIPYGRTITYSELARRVGRPSASRAVGAANGRNPLSILVPCHRVVGAEGRLTGYAGGLERKRWLLDWERARGRLFDADAGRGLQSVGGKTHFRDEYR